MDRFIAISALLTVFVATACFGGGGDGDSNDDVILVSEGTTVNAYVEEVIAGNLTGAAAVSQYRVVLSQPDTATALDIVAPPQPLSDLDGSVVIDAASWSEGRISDGMMILSDDGLWVWDGFFAPDGGIPDEAVIDPSPIGDAIDVSQLREIAARGEELWLATESEISLWHDGWLHSVDIGGAIAAPPFALGPAVAGSTSGTVWVSSADGLVELAGNGENWTAIDFRAGVIADSIAVTGDGRVWVATDGEVHGRDADGRWSIYRFPAPVRAVAGNPAASAVWVATESDTFVSGVSGGSGDPAVGAASFSAVSGMGDGTLGQPGDWQVDDSGRLLARTESGLQRVSNGRPVALVGLPDDGVIFLETEVFLAPTSGHEVVDLTASLAGDSLTLQATSKPGVWRTIMDPVAIASGTHDLDVAVTYADGDASTRTPVIVANPTWEADIFPIYQNHCSFCHDGATDVPALYDQVAWRSRFADLLDRVERDNMPLGQEPLSAFQKAMIRAWGAKGFPD